eukprot:347041_1
MTHRVLLWFMLALCYKHISAEYEEWLDEFDHFSYLDDDDDYCLYWTPYPDDCYIEFGLEVSTSGWVGIGISLTGAMNPADVVIGWVDEDGQAYLVNAHTIGKQTPIPFTDQNGIKLIDAWQQDDDGTEKTYLRFEKELFPASYRENSIDIQLGTTRVIYAWNEDDPDDNELMKMEQHSFNDRGRKSLNLLSGYTPFVERPSDADYTDILQPEVNVPSDDTTYWCTLFEVSDLPDIQHIVEIEPIIEEGNEGIVHHFALSICPTQFVDPEYVGTQWDCSQQANMPTNKSHCEAGYIMYAWAVGGGTFYFPENVGMEIGGDTIRYLSLQTHYDNPLEASGHIDSSGLRLWHTSTLRDETATIFAIGDGYDQFIPHGIESTWNYAYLTGECSRLGIPESGVKVFANMHHQHLLGRAGIIRHIRNGKELPPIDINLAYDFDYQQYVPLKEQITLLPGDEFIVECEVDSSTRTEWTIGGESTRNEMCVTFFMVYPKPNIVTTSTTFLPEDKTKWFEDAMALGYINAETGQYDVSIDGALEFYEEFQKLERRFSFCLDFYGNGILPEGETISIPYGFEEYEVDNNLGCKYDSDVSESSGFEWDSWYVYTVASVIGVLLIGLIVYFGFKCVGTKKQEEAEIFMAETQKEGHEYGAIKNKSEGNEFTNQ